MGRFATVPLALGMMLSLASSPMGVALVSRFHLAKSLAVAIVAVLASGGATAVLALYPFLLPVIGTTEFMLAVFGVASTVAF